MSPKFSNVQKNLKHYTWRYAAPKTMIELHCIENRVGISTGLKVIILPPVEVAGAAAYRLVRSAVLELYFIDISPCTITGI